MIASTDRSREIWHGVFPSPIGRFTNPSAQSHHVERLDLGHAGDFPGHPVGGPETKLGSCSVHDEDVQIQTCLVKAVIV